MNRRQFIRLTCQSLLGAALWPKTDAVVWLKTEENDPRLLYLHRLNIAAAIGIRTPLR